MVGRRLVRIFGRCDVGGTAARSKPRQGLLRICDRKAANAGHPLLLRFLLRKRALVPGRLFPVAVQGRKLFESREHGEVFELKLGRMRFARLAKVYLSKINIESSSITEHGHLGTVLLVGQSKGVI